MTDNDADEWLPVEEAAKRLNVSVRQTQRYGSVANPRLHRLLQASSLSMPRHMRMRPDIPCQPVSTSRHTLVCRGMSRYVSGYNRERAFT